MRHQDFARLAHRITHLCGDTNYTFIHFTDEPTVLYSKTMLDCLPYLPGLIRIHRKYSANPQFISEYRPVLSDNTGEVRIGQIWLPISRRRRQDIIHLLHAMTPVGQIKGLPIRRVPTSKPGGKADISLQNKINHEEEE